MMKRVAIAALLALVPAPGIAEKLDVKIINREANETNYDYVVPGHSYSNTNGDANCNANAYGNSATANCAGTSHTNTTTTAPRPVSFSVTGATLTLLLPDGRTVVVNCASKFSERMAGREGNHRSCREPMVEYIQAEFKGQNAKLFWIVSLDGKKVESETYKIVAIVNN